MFSDNYIRLCASIGKGVTVVSQEIGYSSVAGKKWASGSVPRQTTLIKIANYFGVTVEELLKDVKSPAVISDSEGYEKDEAIKLYQNAPQWLRDQILGLLKAEVSAREGQGKDPKV